MVRGLVSMTLLALMLGGCAATTASPSAPSRSAALGCADLPGELAQGESLGTPLRVLAVRNVHERIGRQVSGAVRGVEVRVRAAHGMDDVAVRRTILCRAAIASSPSDPLAVVGAHSRVDRRGLDYVVTVTARGRDAAQEIAERASRLAR